MGDKIVSVNVIEYGPDIPKTLRDACNRMGGRVAQVTYDDGIDSPSGHAYNIMLCYGYCFDARAHIRLENTVRDAIRALREVRECRCAECVEGLAE